MRHHVGNSALVLVGLGFAAVACAQPRQVRVHFEIDGKDRTGPQRIELFSSDGRRLAVQRIRGGSFAAPLIGLSEKVNVHLRFAGRTLVFTGVYGAKFEGAWTVGIDQAPFDEEDASALPAGAKPKEVWFIKFEPSTGDGTRMVVTGH